MHTDVALEVEREDSHVLIDFLVDNINISKTRLKKCIQIGAVWLIDGEHRQRIRKATSRIQEGDIIEVFYDDARLDSKALTCELIEDCEEYSLWYKPQGIPMHGDDFGDSHCVSRQIEYGRKGEDYWMITFPSDAQSGLILIAHSRNMTSTLNDMLKNGQIESTFMLTVVGDIDESKLSDYKATKVSYRANVDKSRIAVSVKTDAHNATKKWIEDNLFEIACELDDENEVVAQEVALKSIAMICPVKGKPRNFEGL